MPDPADLGNEDAQLFLDQCLAAVPHNIPVGEPGKCVMCYEFNQRLVGGVCSPCRDRYKLP